MSVSIDIYLVFSFDDQSANGAYRVGVHYRCAPEIPFRIFILVRTSMRILFQLQVCYAVINEHSAFPYLFCAPPPAVYYFIPQTG